MFSALKIAGIALLAWVPAFALAYSIMGLAWSPADPAFAQGTPSDNPMRSMMRVMMQGLVPPPGMIAERLPDPVSSGAKLTADYCAQCHDLPSPRYKTADQWPEVFERMLGRVKMMSSGGIMGRGMMGMSTIDAPTVSEARTILRYLTDHAMREATSDELAVGDPSDRGVFQVTCSRCHALPSPYLFSPREWPELVARMEGNMQLMNKRVIAKEEREAIIRYLKAAATKAR